MSRPTHIADIGHWKVQPNLTNTNPTSTSTSTSTGLGSVEGEGTCSKICEAAPKPEPKGQPGWVVCLHLSNTQSVSSPYPPAHTATQAKQVGSPPLDIGPRRTRLDWTDKTRVDRDLDLHLKTLPPGRALKRQDRRRLIQRTQVCAGRKAVQAVPSWCLCHCIRSGTGGTTCSSPSCTMM